MFGVEAVLACVLIAGLAAALTLFVLIAAEVVEGALGGFLGDSEAVWEVFAFLCIFVLYFSWEKGSRGWGLTAQGVDVTVELGRGRRDTICIAVEVSWGRFGGMKHSG